MKKRTKQKYVFLDTSVLINCCLRTENKEDVSVLEKFKEKLQNGEFLLLLPESIDIEFHRIVNERYASVAKRLEDWLNINIKQFKSHPRIKALLNDYFESKNFKKKIERMSKDIEKNLKRSRQVLKKIFKNNNVIRIPLTESIILSSFKRGLSGRKPYKTIAENLYGPILQSDCMHVEAVRQYLTDKKNYILIICSADKDYEDTVNPGQVSRDILEDFKGEVKYYKFLYKFLTKEFRIRVDEQKLTATRSIPITASLSGLFNVCNQCHVFHFDGFCPTTLSISQTIIQPICDRCGLSHPFSICPYILSSAIYAPSAIQELCKSCRNPLQSSILNIGGLCLACQQGGSMVC